MKKAISIMSVLLIVFLCSFPTYATTITSEERYGNADNTILDGQFAWYINGLVMRPNILDHDYNFEQGRTYYGTSTYPYPANPYNWRSEGTSIFYEIPVDITVTLRNQADYVVYGGGNYIGVLPDFNFDVQPDAWSYEILSNDVVIYNIMNTGEFRFRISNQDLTYQGNPAIGVGSSWSFTFRIHFLYHYDIGDLTGSTVAVDGTSLNQLDFIDINSISLVNPQTWTLSNMEKVYGNKNILLWQIRERISSIYNQMFSRDTSYNDVSSDSASLDSGSSSTQTQSDTNHQTELSYFNQTNTALNNSGISNYQFDNEQVGGIGAVSNDFTSVWNSLGSWTSVYIFSLTLSLGLAIIRHVRPIKRSNEE